MIFNNELKQYYYRVVVAGLPGSGKSTSLNSLVALLAQCYRTEKTMRNEPSDVAAIESLTVSFPKVSDTAHQFTMLCCDEISSKTGRRLLAVADALVLVIDSQASRLEENIRFLIQLVKELRALNITPESFPIYYQYNKADAASALPKEQLDEKLNPLHAPACCTSVQHAVDFLQAYESVFRTLMLQGRQTTAQA